MPDAVLILYHGGRCLDGFGAAWSAWRHFRRTGESVTWVAASHGDAPPDATGKRVWLLDYCLPRDTLRRLCREAKQVTVVDHHVSALEDTRGLEAECPNLCLEFDLTHSGAVLAWQHFHTEPVPGLLRHIEDRDLWNWAIEGSRDTTAALMARPYDFAEWDALFDDPEAPARLRAEGEAINRYRQQMIDHYRKRAVMGRVAGYRVPVVNSPVEIHSELLGELAKGHPFAAGYLDRDGRRGWSLRSTAAGLNVAEIARRFGGGGHPRAAGFSTPLGDDNFNVDP